MSAKRLSRANSENRCPINRLASNLHITSNKTENSNEFGKFASAKPDPDLISAYVPDARPDTVFLCLFNP